ncbi:hypothetical protein SASPL_138121 [Salvia splendens]|uniref:Pto-interacting protein 1 n=1 Tax=Salvia splendens TaxID=180675 RepID=A0A8X8WVR0_SALSN|nr:hypothetical protein SASPL_138121 [Salvia splendens]
MGNCWCGWEPLIYRVSSNTKSESPDQGDREKVRKDERKLPSNPEEVEDLRRCTSSKPLTVFTFNELKSITSNFRQDYLLGGGGFGSVYKGYISEDIQGLQPITVAVKVHDGDNSSQGHREWLWAIPLLKEKKKVLDIVDARLGGDYPVKGVQKAAMLAYHCLNRNPKARPLMRDIVDSFEAREISGKFQELMLFDAREISEGEELMLGLFLYCFPSDDNVWNSVACSFD